MSFSQIRRIPDARQIISQLSKALAEFNSKNQLHQADDTDFIRLMRTDFDYVLATSDVFDVQVHPRTKLFKLPMEPDGDSLVLWLRFNHPSNFEIDASGFQNTTEVFGNPYYRAGKYSLSPHLDGINDAIMVYDDQKLRGFSHMSYSLVVIVNPDDLSLNGNENTVPRYVVIKADDDRNQYAIAIRPDGTVNLTVKVDNVISVVETPANTALLNQWNTIIATFGAVGFDPKVFDNNVFEMGLRSALIECNGVGNSFVMNTTALAATGPIQRVPLTAQPLELITPNSNLFNPALINTPIGDEETTGFITELVADFLKKQNITENMFIGARNLNGNADGNFSGLIDEVRVYRNTALDAQQRSNLLTNGFTISNIPAEQVAIIGRWYISLLDPTVEPPAPEGYVFNSTKHRYNIIIATEPDAPGGYVFKSTKHKYHILAPTGSIISLIPTYTNKFSSKGFHSS